MFIIIKFIIFICMKNHALLQNEMSCHLFNHYEFIVKVDSVIITYTQVDAIYFNIFFVKFFVMPFNDEKFTER